MPTTLKARFDTRRDAEMTVERLVQELKIDRTDIFIAADGDANSAGSTEAGSDTAGDDPTPESRTDAALEGRILVSVDLQDEARAAEVNAAFAEFAGGDVSQG
jgi:hypothetical protein